MCAVHPDRLLVFVPEYHIRGTLRLTDRRGLPVPPAATDEQEKAEGKAGRDAFALAARRRLHLETGANPSSTFNNFGGASSPGLSERVLQ